MVFRADCVIHARGRLKDFQNAQIHDSMQDYYLTIRLRARYFYEVIVDEGEARINYHLIEIKSE